MDKRLLVLGIALVIAGFLVAGSSYSPSNYISTSAQEIAIAPNNNLYSSITLNTTGFFEVFYSSGNVPINFYILNNSAFAYIEPYLNSSSLPYNSVTQLQGKGLLYATHNSTRGVYPYNSSYSSLGLNTPSYSSSSYNSMPAGKYYIVYSNPTNTYANTTYEYVLPNVGLLNPNSSFYSSLSATSIASSLLFLAGIILAVLSFFRKSKSKEDPKAREAEIAKLYSQIDAKAKKKRRRSKKAKQKGRKRKRKGARRRR